MLADRLRRLDERSTDVAVLDQSFAVRDPRLFGEAGGGDRSGVGNADHEVGGRGRRLLGEDPSHLATHVVHRPLLQDRVGARKVDVLEDAELRFGLRVDNASQAVVVHRHDLARLHVPDELRPHDVQRARFACDHPTPTGETADRKRPHAVRIPHAVHGVLVHDHQRERTLEQRHRVRDGLLERTPVLRQQRRDHVGVRRRARLVVRLVHHRSDVDRVRQVAVVPQRNPAPAGRNRAEGRLRVLPLAGPGGRVPRVSDPDVTLQCGERRLVEDLSDEAHVLVDDDARAVGDRDAGCFLATVLEGVQAEEDELGDLFTRRPYAEETTLFAGRIVA